MLRSVKYSKNCNLKKKQLFSKNGNHEPIAVISKWIELVFEVRLGYWMQVRYVPISAQTIWGHQRRKKQAKMKVKIAHVESCTIQQELQAQKSNFFQNMKIVNS